MDPCKSLDQLSKGKKNLWKQERNPSGFQIPPTPVWGAKLCVLVSTAQMSTHMIING